MGCASISVSSEAARWNSRRRRVAAVGNVVILTLELIKVVFCHSGPGGAPRQRRVLLNQTHMLIWQHFVVVYI